MTGIVGVGVRRADPELPVLRDTVALRCSAWSSGGDVSPAAKGIALIGGGRRGIDAEPGVIIGAALISYLKIKGAVSLKRHGVGDVDQRGRSLAAVVGCLKSEGIFCDYFIASVSVVIEHNDLVFLPGGKGTECCGIVWGAHICRIHLKPSVVWDISVGIKSAIGTSGGEIAPAFEGVALIGGG